MSLKRSMKSNALALVAGCVLLSSCAMYKDELVPPSSASGVACVSQCNGSKQSCQISKQALAQQCEAIHSRALSDYQSCKAKNPATSYCTSYKTVTTTVNGQPVAKQECTSTRYESPCKEPVKTCNTAPDLNQCDTNFKACFTSCGGVINRIEIK